MLTHTIPNNSCGYPILASAMNAQNSLDHLVLDNSLVSIRTDGFTFALKRFSNSIRTLTRSLAKSWKPIRKVIWW